MLYLHTSQFRAAMLQVLNSHRWLVAEEQDSAALGPHSGSNSCSLVTSWYVRCFEYHYWSPLLKPQYSVMRGHGHWIYSLAQQGCDLEYRAAYCSLLAMEQASFVPFLTYWSVTLFKAHNAGRLGNTRGCASARPESNAHTHPPGHCTVWAGWMESSVSLPTTQSDNGTVSTAS